MLPDRFLRLKQSHQAGVAGGLVLAGAVLVYVLAWQPVNSALRQGREEAASAAETLAAVRSYARRIEALQANGPPAATENLTGLVNDGLQARQLAFTRLQQLSAEQVQVRLDDVAFAAALAWLYDMESTPGLEIGDLSVRPSGPAQAGLISMTVGLSRVN